MPPKTAVPSERRAAEPAPLRLDVQCIDFKHRDLEHLFHGFFHLMLVGIPVDFKTASRGWSQYKASREMQPVFYLAALIQVVEELHHRGLIVLQVTEDSLRGRRKTSKPPSTAKRMKPKCSNRTRSASAR